MSGLLFLWQKVKLKRRYMQTIRKGSKGAEVRLLRGWLALPGGDEFDAATEAAVKEYQRQEGLAADGIVGSKTWFALACDNVARRGNVAAEDYESLASALNIEEAALRAVIDVETGGKGGFCAAGKASILFEGHVFYAELKAAKKNVTDLAKRYPKIVYPKWTKAYYVGGTGEWGRFKIACEIERTCAIKATSFGLFQILGRNYKLCGCKSAEDFFSKMQRNEAWQLVLGLRFIVNSGLVPYLKKKDWTAFARRYNGSGQVSYYAGKLRTAYEKRL